MPVKGWTAPQPELADVMGIAKNPAADGMSAEASISVVRLTKVFTNFLTPDPVEGNKDAVTADAPSDMVAWLQANPYLRVSQPSTRRIAGVKATVVDVEANPLPADQAAGTCEGSGPCVTLLSLEHPAAYIAISEGAKQTWAILRIGATTILVEWDMQVTERATKATYAAQIAKIVQSLKIG
jgi:hypothetical protein